MTFAWPHLLWLLIVPFGWLIWELTRAHLAESNSHPNILRAQAGPHSVRLLRFASGLSTGRVRAHPWLALGLAFAIAALARPQWGRLEEPVFDQSREILIAIDLSRSMEAQDVKPSRLDRAKLLTQSLLEKLKGERVGLLVFSGTAFLQSPLSSDYEILREFLPALKPSYLPEGGTNYTALIDTALGAFGSSDSADRFLVILSDGEATDEDWRSRVDDLKQRHIRVIGLGVGTTAGAMIPDGSGGLIKDDRGAVVLSKLESGTLRDLAQATDGVYRDASNWLDLAQVIDDTVNQGRKGQFLEKHNVRLVERFQWPLGLALWCLLVSLYFEFPVRPRPREIKLHGTAPIPGTAQSPAPRPPVATASLALLCLLLPLGLLAPSGRAAEPLDPGPRLGYIYARLANQDRLYAPDLAEIAHATLTWGRHLQESGKPVPEGPVKDAIRAVDQLISINSKIANWAKLRTELEALLEKPKDQKKDQQQQKQDQKQNQDKDQQQNQKQDQKQSSQNQKDRNQQKDQQQKQQQQQQSQPKDSSRQSDDKDASSKHQPPHQANPQSAFGNMKDHQKPPAQPKDMQKVGGVPKKKEGDQPPVDPSLTLPLEKLDQLRNQDSPAELFQLMEPNKKQPEKKPAKDW